MRDVEKYRYLHKCRNRYWLWLDGLTQHSVL